MKKLLLVLLLAGSTFAQITITKDDLSNFYKSGVTWYDYTSDTLKNVTMDIGSASASAQTWTFPSNIQFTDTAVYNNISTAGSPFISDFPTATHCFSFDEDLGVMVVKVYTYLKLGDRIITLGTGFELAGVPMKTMIINDTSNSFPITYGKKDSYVRRSTTEMGTVETFVTSECDGFGKIVTPYGTFDALRIVETSESKVNVGGTVVSSTTGKQIVFTSKGVNVVFDVEPNSATSGTVNVKTASIEVYDLSGAATDVKENISAVNDFKLNQNYPNPFNPSTLISYQLPVSGHVELKVYDLLGREVASLVNKEQSAGNYQVNFNAAGLTSGMYIYRLQAGDKVESRKMQLLR
jgi:hypothetical protein